MELLALVPFVIACMIIEITPGPNMTYLALASMQHGRRAGVATLLGVALGLLTLGLTATYGVATLLQHYPPLYHLLQITGIVYLVYLAYDAWRGDTRDTVRADLHFFQRGLITNLLNPKAALFYITVFPKFVDAAHPIHPQMLTLTLIYVAIASMAHVLIVLLAAPVGKRLQTPQRQQFMRRFFAGLLLLVALWMAMIS
jgi:threonine/homoserine/homoserine lactone efflux protein